MKAATLLAPQVHATGVDAGTAATLELLLRQEIERSESPRLLRSDTIESSRPCAEPACVGRRVRRAGADEGLLCTLARLGEEFVVTLQRVDAAGRVQWTDRVSVRQREDLDAAAERLARSLAGRPASSKEIAAASAAPVDSVVQGEAQPKPSWTTQGPRVGRLSPLGDAYAGAGALTSLAYVWRYQTPDFNVEVIPALGYAWGGDKAPGQGLARDWTLLDVFVAWTPVGGDLGPYIGCGLGLHSIKLEREETSGPFAGRREAGETAPTLSLGCGLLLFRSYDFQVGLDLRFQHFTHAFDSLGGDGARGFSMTFGIQHR